jgi:ABC-type multidrug transport system fused ATPase/permease subunit
LKTGLYISGNNIIGGKFSEDKLTAPVLKSVIRSFNDKISDKCAAGVGWDNVETDHSFTPETDDKKILETALLQDEYYQNDSEEGKYWSNSIFGKGEKGTGIMRIQTPVLDELPKKSAVYPCYVALYALAHRQGLTTAGSNTLVLFFFDGTVMSLAIQDQDIVFARLFADNENLPMNVKISAQSVFFVKQRHLLEVDNILVISDSSGDFEKVEQASESSTKVSFLDVSGYFTEHQLSDTERAGMIIAYGLSFAPEIDALAKWNILNSFKGKWTRKKGYLIRIAILILLGLPVIFAAEIISNRVLIDELDRKSEAIEPIYKRVSSTLSEINLMKEFTNHTGRKLIGQDVCFELFKKMEKSRNDQLWLTSVAGNPFKIISINGMSNDYPSLLKFIDGLSLEKDIENSELIFANLSDGGKVEFQIILKYKFSKEFQKPVKKQENIEE